MKYDKINKEAKYVNPNKICGIYCIYNEQYFYIGQSNDIKKRWNSHRSKLNRNVHVNYIMQQVYNKFPEDPFAYKIICECEEKNLDKLEIIVKNKLCEKYPEKICMNIANCGRRVSWTDEMKRKASISHKGKIFSEEHKKHISEGQKGIKRPLQYVKIVQLDLNGNLIKIWDSVQEAENTYGKINYNRKSSHNYQWQRYEDWKNNPKGAVSYISIEKEIYQFSKNKQLIRKYKSIQEAANILGIDRDGIHKALSGKLKTSGGYLWSYNEHCPDVELKTKERKTLPVYQYDLNMNLLNIWKSTKEASLNTGIPESTIRGSINEHKKGKYYIWKRN